MNPPEQKRTTLQTGAKKRKSIVVCFGSYSLDGWEVNVMQITRTSISHWGFQHVSNHYPGHPRFRTIRQIRSAGLAAGRRLSKEAPATFGWIRPTVYWKSAKRLTAVSKISGTSAVSLL